MDVTDVFKASVATQRKRLELKTPASEILPPTRKRHAFTTDALSSLQSIRTVQSFLQDSHAAYMLDDILEGMSEAERDDAAAEARRPPSWNGLSPAGLPATPLLAAAAPIM